MFETKPDPQLTELKEQLATMINLQKGLLNKLEKQNAMLVTLAKFCSENSPNSPAFSIG